MAPTPRSAASMFSEPSIAAQLVNPLSHAAYNGDLHLFKKLVRLLELDEGKGSLREAVEASRADRGMWPLQHAALGGRLEVCRYLVEELRVDVDVPGDEGTTALMYAIYNEKTAVAKYLLDHGANPDKADGWSLTPLHHAAGLGNCEIVESLLAKGAHVDPIALRGTPQHLAANKGQAGKLDYYADVNKMDMIFPVTPLFLAIEATSVKCMKLLVEAGADVKADCILAALNDDTNIVSSECLSILMEAGANRDVPDNEEGMNKMNVADLKSLGSKAVERKDYLSASGFYSKAMVLDPEDATLFSNRSLCWLRMGDGQKALMDALECKKLRPDWTKACYRQGAALLLLKDYKSACDALFDGFKMDPENAEIEHALREAMESLKISQSAKAK